MKKIQKAVLFIALMIACPFMAMAQSSNPNTKWHWDKGTIVVDTPERPAGQQSALGMTAPKLETVRVGFVGLGSRGPWAVNRYCNKQYCFLNLFHFCIVFYC